jgi:hypothetical protein
LASEIGRPLERKIEDSPELRLASAWKIIGKEVA